MRKEENKMGTLPIGKLLFTMSFPPMLSMIINALYNIVDSIFLAQVSQNALTAVTLVFPVQMLMIAVCVGMGVGLSSLISRRLGAKRQAEANSAAAHGFVIALICWVIFAIFGAFIAEHFIRLFTDNAEILSMALTYCRFVTIGSAFMCVSICIERIMQSGGDMMRPMIFNSVGAVINAALAPVFIIGLFGAPALGVTGAGLVAITGQCIAMIIAIVMFVRNEHKVSVNFKGFKVSSRILSDIFAVGAPTMVMMSIMSIMVTGFNAILSVCLSTRVAETAIAVLGVYFRIQSFIFMPVFGMNQGSLPIMGFNFGARNKKRLMDTYKLTVKVAMIIMAGGVALFWIFPGQIMMLFSAQGEMMEMGVHALRSISLLFVPAAFSIATVTMFQATAHGRFAMALSVVRQLVFLLPLAYLLLANFGIDYVWYAFPLAEISAVIMTLLFLRYVLKNEINRLPEGSVSG